MAIFLMLIGTFMSACSLVLMKVGHKRVMNNDGNICYQMFWLLGMAMMMSREVVHISALSFGNQVLLSSSSSITIIYNTIMSVIFLKETLYKTDIFAISMIFTGSIIFLQIAHNKKE